MTINGANSTNVMAVLADAGVVDAGNALYDAARLGNEGAIKSLLQEQQRPEKHGEIAVVWRT